MGTTRVGETDCAAFDADCVTLNGYMGSDAIKPFLDQCVARNKSAFVLAKTSNPVVGGAAGHGGRGSGGVHRHGRPY